MVVTCVTCTWPGEPGESLRESGCGERRLQWPESREAGEEEHGDAEGRSRDLLRENFRENADSEPGTHSHPCVGLKHLNSISVSPTLLHARFNVLLLLFLTIGSCDI